MFLFGKRKKAQKEDKPELIEEQSTSTSDTSKESSDDKVALVNPLLIQELASDKAPSPTAEQAQTDTPASDNETTINSAIDKLLLDPITPHSVVLDDKVNNLKHAAPAQDAIETVQEADNNSNAETINQEAYQAVDHKASTVDSEPNELSPTIDSPADNTFIIEAPQTPSPAPSKKAGLFSRLRQGLSKTGSALTDGMGALVLGKKKVDDDLLEELETRLLMADVGIEATQEIMDDLSSRVSRKQLSDADSLMKALEEKMSAMLAPAAKTLTINTENKPTIILMVGINGAGKTTTIGKLAKKYQAAGKSVMLAAGDTFRAAAVEQLQTWGERNDVPVIAQGTGSDTASVIYDAVQSAQARHVDILLADTAGRLHTQNNLMDELKKVKRVIQKLDASAPHEIMLIVDASIGQNALIQAKEFNQALGITGITITKLDGTAKGGILFAIAQQLDVAIRYVGVGEGIDDLQVFDAQKFTQALLSTEEHKTH